MFKRSIKNTFILTCTLFILSSMLCSCFSTIRAYASSSSYYIVNTETGKFHLPSCSYLPENSNSSIISKSTAISSSKYSPCGHCKPLSSSYYSPSDNSSGTSSSKKSNDNWLWVLGLVAISLLIVVIVAKKISAKASKKKEKEKEDIKALKSKVEMLSAENNRKDKLIEKYLLQINSSNNLLSSYENQKNVLEAPKGEFSEAPTSENITDQNDILLSNVSSIHEAIQRNFRTFTETRQNTFLKGSQLVQLDYSIYVYFTLYCALCRPGREYFVADFLNIAENYLNEYYAERLDEKDLSFRIIEERLNRYDEIMQSSADREIDINHQLLQYITKDIHTNDPLSKSIFINDAFENIEILTEIRLLSNNVFNDINPLFEDLTRLTDTYSYFDFS